jgi:hypothetical protein
VAMKKFSHTPEVLLCFNLNRKKISLFRLAFLCPTRIFVVVGGKGMVIFNTCFVKCCTLGRLLSVFPLGKTHKLSAILFLSHTANLLIRDR